MAKKIAIGLAGFLLLLNLIWVGASSYYLNSSHFTDWLQTKGLSLKVGKAWSPFPGLFYGRDLAYDGVTKNVRFTVEVEKLRFFLNFAALRNRHTSLSYMEAVGTSFVMHPVEGKGEAKTEAEAVLDELRVRKKAPWEVSLSNFIFRDIKHFAIGEWNWKGTALLTIDLHKDKEGFFNIGLISLEDQNSQIIRNGTHPIGLQKVKIAIEGEDFAPRLETWRETASKLNIKAEVKGALPSLVPLQPYWSQLKWLNLESNAITVDANVTLDHGVFQRGSCVKIDSPQMQLGILRQAIRGPAAIEWTAEDLVRLALKFGKFELGEGVGDGEGLALILETPQKSLVEPLTQWSAKIDWPESRIHRLAAFQRYFPNSVPFKVEGGAGRVQAELLASSQGGQSGGWVNIAVQKMQGVYGKDLRFTSDLNTRIEASRLDLDRGELAIDHARSEVRNLAFNDVTGWNGDLILSKTLLGFEEPVKLEGDLSLSGRDLSPVIAFIASEKSWPSWILKPAELKNPKLSLHVDAREDRIHVQNIKAEAEQLKIAGWYQHEQNQAHGRFRFDYGVLSAGLERKGEDMDWRFPLPKDFLKEGQLSSGR